MSLTTIPIIWLVSAFSVLLAALVAGGSRRPWAARGCFAAALGLIALVTGLIGLRLEYPALVFGRLQPHLAAPVAPLLWLGFRSLTLQAGRPGSGTLIRFTLALIAAELALLLPMPWSADVIVVTVNMASLILLASLLRRGADAFVQVPPERFHALRLCLIAATAFVALILLADAAIIMAALSAGRAGMMQALTGVSGLMAGLVLIGTIIGVPLVLGPPTDARPMPEQAQKADRGLLAKIDQLLTESLIFRDPDLTLARLGRRLGCPARAVSMAINRGSGENVSRYINGFRIRHAQGLLAETDLPVTEIMLEAGFVSKSSFNAEFRRITGVTPSEFRRNGSQTRSRRS